MNFAPDSLLPRRTGQPGFFFAKWRNQRRRRRRRRQLIKRRGTFPLGHPIRRRTDGRTNRGGREEDGSVRSRAILRWEGGREREIAADGGIVRRTGRRQFQRNMLCESPERERERGCGHSTTEHREKEGGRANSKLKVTAAPLPSFYFHAGLDKPIWSILWRN